jgi:HNH endonuclease
MANEWYKRNKGSHRQFSNAAERFWTKVKKAKKCWIWKSAVGLNGYGYFHTKHAGTQYAHRIVWQLTYGKIPSGLFVLHSCDNRACVNPTHLFLGTHQDNINDCVAKGRHLVSRNVPKGENQYNAKLTKRKILAIRAAYAKGKLTQYELADRYGIHQAHVWRIVRFKTWRHIQ